MISFEFPLTERVRTLLRLEDLFQRMAVFQSHDDTFDHHAALILMFEIAELGARSDLKMDLLKELDRQRGVLEALRDNPIIAEDALDEVLGQIEESANQLRELSGRFGHHVRDNEWLTMLRQRLALSNGACSFDLPSYYFWMQQTAEERRADMTLWCEPLFPAWSAVQVLLKILRDNAKTYPQIARAGAFQQMAGGRVVHLIRISLDPTLKLVPELSANKHVINIRLTSPVSCGERAKQADGDIPFLMTFCRL